MSTNSANDTELYPMVRELAEGKNFAAVSTHMPNGSIQTQMIWVDARDGKIVLNTETHRAKYRNIRRDPRVTVLIRDEDDPYRYAEIRGEVVTTTTGRQAREHIDKLAHKYTGGPYPPENIKSERVMLWISPSRQVIVDQSRGVGE